MRLSHVAAVVALVGATALICSSGSLRADDATRDAVERLMPQLTSDDDVARGDAEHRLFDLGEPARAELERITRGADPRKAVTALRLLQSPKLAKPATGEKRVRPQGGEADGGGPADEGFRARVRRDLEEMRRHIEYELGRGFSFEFPETGAGVHGRASGTFVEDGKKTAWALEDDGRITVTLQDGKDAAEQKYEAKSFAELKKDHPDVAGRVETLLPKDGRHGFWFRFAPFSRERRREGAVPEDGRRPPAETPSPEGAAVPPSLGIEWSPASDALRAQLELADGALVVESVVPGSLAEKLALQRFDVLLELNGHAVAQSLDVREALDGVKPGDAVKALVVRKGRRLTLEAKR